MNLSPHLTRRTLLAGLAVLALGGGTGVAAGSYPAPADLDSPAGPSSEQPAVRRPSITRGTARSAAGKVAFPMQVTPRCAVLANFADSRSGGRSHEGIDILATRGQQVYAPAAGTLVTQYVDGQSNASLSGSAWGLESTDGNYYFFAHLSGFADSLVLGQTVLAGQLIGYVGDTGNPGTDNFHLHFEIHPGGMKKAAVNPLTLLEVPTACSVTKVTG